MSLLEICRYLQEMPPATALRESTIMFPVIESTHVLGLAFMMGPVLMLDLRLIGVMWRGDSVSKIAGQLLPATLFGFALMATTGSLLFWSEAVKCYHSTYFRIKVVLLILAGLNALLFHSTIWLRLSEWENHLPPPGRARFAGYASILLWIFVIFAGRYTAYNL